MMVEIDKLLKVTGMSSSLADHQRTAYSHRSSNRIMRTQICQNSPVVRTSWTKTDNPAGYIVEGRGEGGRVQKGERAEYLKVFREERGEVQAHPGAFYTLGGSELEVIITRVRHRRQ